MNTPRRHPISSRLRQARWVTEFYEDWVEGYVSGDRWTATLTDSGTAAIQDTRNGIMHLAASDGTVVDNDQSLLFTTDECVIFDPELSLHAEAYGAWNDAGAGAEANWFWGFANAPAADLLIDTGGGPKATGDVIGFYAVDGSAYWNVIVQINGVTLFELALTAVNSFTGLAYAHDQGTTKQHLVMDFEPRYDGLVTVIFRIDNDIVAIARCLSPANATECAFGFSCKNGANTNNQTVRNDFCGYTMSRDE